MININDVDRYILLGRWKSFPIIECQPLLLDNSLFMSAYIRGKYIIHFCFEAPVDGQYHDVGIWYEYEVPTLEQLTDIDEMVGFWYVKNLRRFRDFNEYLREVGFFKIENYTDFRKSSYVGRIAGDAP